MGYAKIPKSVYPFAIPSAHMSSLFKYVVRIVSFAAESGSNAKRISETFKLMHCRFSFLVPSESNCCCVVEVKWAAAFRIVFKSDISKLIELIKCQKDYLI